MLHSETVLVGPFELYFHSVVCYYVKIKLCYLSRTFLCTNQQNSFSYKKLLVFSQFWGGVYQNCKSYCETSSIKAAITRVCA
jgi:hypothetical protein